jgi:tol-pal system protein YbgF
MREVISLRDLGLGLATCVIVTLAGCATTPPDKDPVQIKLNDLDGRLARIERVLANQSLLDLANQIEAARSDVRSLRNDVDLLNNNLAGVRTQERDLYADLDRRIKLLEARGVVAGGTAAAVAANGATGTSAAGGTGAPTGAALAAGAAAGGAGALPVPGGTDKANYEAAFALLKDSQYEQATAAFKQFLMAFPDSSYADNAQYWLGEAYYVNKNFTDSLAAFEAVIDKYPQSRKVPDAMLKVGYCDYELKQWAAAREVLGAVVDKFADTPAGNLAKQRLDRMDAEKH